LDARVARAAVAVEGAEAEPGPPRDLRERRIEASLGEALARSRDEELVVSPRVAAQALLLAGDLGHGITLARNRRHSSGFCYRPENERYEPRAARGGPHRPGADDRLRGADARHVPRRARPDDRLDRAADDRRRPRRPQPPLVGRHLVSPGLHGLDADLREAR